MGRYTDDRFGHGIDPETPVTFQVDDVTRIDKIARIRIWRDELLMSAPDYIHRQIGGYPGFKPAEAP
jgi:hypothetical protein